MTPTARDPADPPAGAPRGRVALRRRETAVCVGLSAALHLGALAAFATIAPSGAPSGGSDGVMTVTLVRSDATPPEQLRPEPETVEPTPPAPPRPPQPDPVMPVADPAPPPEADTANLAAAATPAAAPEPGPRPRPKGLRPAAPVAAPVAATPRAEARQGAKAAGAGGAPAAGARGSAPLATGPSQAQASALQAWGAAIQRALQRGLAAPRGVERDLRVVLALSVAPDGRLRDAGVARSSGDAAIDAAALRAVRRIGRLPAAPEGMTAAAYPFIAPIDLDAR